MEFVQCYSGPPETDSMLAQFRVTDVSEDGELVDYSIEISENLLLESNKLRSFDSFTCR